MLTWRVIFQVSYYNRTETKYSKKNGIENKLAMSVFSRAKTERNNSLIVKEKKDVIFSFSLLTVRSKLSQSKPNSSR